MESSDSESLTSKNEAEINLKNPLPRESLINTAVTFLSDKKIQSQDQGLLRKFLVKKGLTEEEAAIAFQRVEATRSQSVSLFQQFAPQPFPPQHFPPPVPVHSTWQKIHNIITTVTSVAGILYALYWLWKEVDEVIKFCGAVNVLMLSLLSGHHVIISCYFGFRPPHSENCLPVKKLFKNFQTYISPYLFGRKPKTKTVETTLGELEAAVGSCVEDVKSIRGCLQTLADQRATELTNNVVVSRIQEVKSEVHSLKALLLNRNQFPAAPPTLGSGPLSIPAWQLSSEPSAALVGDGEGEVEGEEEGNGSNGTTNGSDSSLEIVKDPNH